MFNACMVLFPQVAAGLSTQFDVEIFAMAVGAVGEHSVGQVRHDLEITSENSILQLPIKANIHPPMIIALIIRYEMNGARPYRRLGYNCVVKQLRFWLFKVDCEYFKDCNLHVLRIGHTCVSILIIASSEKNRNSQSLNYAIETRPTVYCMPAIIITGQWTGSIYSVLHSYSSE